MIEKKAGIHRGHPEFCRSEITDIMTTVELPNGFVVSMSMFKKMLAESGRAADVNKDGSINVRDMNEVEMREFEERRAAKKERGKRLEAQPRQHYPVARRRIDDHRQPALFDDLDQDQ